MPMPIGHVHAVRLITEAINVFIIFLSEATAVIPKRILNRQRRVFFRRTFNIPSDFFQQTPNRLLDFMTSLTNLWQASEPFRVLEGALNTADCGRLRKSHVSIACLKAMGATEMVRVHCFMCMTLLILLSAAAAAAAAAAGGTMDVGYVQPSNATMFHGVAGGVEWLETEMVTGSCGSKNHIGYCALNSGKQAAQPAASGRPYTSGCLAYKGCRG
ncbi:hypothetical protein MUK42_13554 [Musa troglodytarum]|uniref:Uncharacterized protein n=1 Tax=Musa troglodytarum TaxID=320322 RepID=A0A9E7HKR7_9LILI|nr:hypothetical protein MUK42_13554 [Musa troglodytarum]